MRKQTKDSFKLSYTIVTGIATLSTVLGFSMKDAFPLEKMNPLCAVGVRIAILLIAFAIVSLIIWGAKSNDYKGSIELKVGNNNVIIKQGDLFEEEAWRVIPVDACVETQVDDIVISKESLHGKLIQKYNDVEGIRAAAENEANRLEPGRQEDEVYSFELGSAIPYINGNDRYIMVVLNKLDESFKAETDLAHYEMTLLKMWVELRRVYAGRDISLPILGNGITEFKDKRDDTGNLIRCMLCTLNTSGVKFNSKISIIVNQNENNSLPLYEYKDIYKVVNWETYSNQTKEQESMC